MKKLKPRINDAGLYILSNLFKKALHSLAGSQIHPLRELNLYVKLSPLSSKAHQRAEGPCQIGTRFAEYIKDIPLSTYNGGVRNFFCEQGEGVPNDRPAQQTAGPENGKIMHLNAKTGFATSRYGSLIGIVLCPQPSGSLADAIDIPWT
jgi:hypothetical protein